MSQLSVSRNFSFGAVLCVISTFAGASEIERLCLGNIETFDRQIIQAGVNYKLWYQVSGTSVKVRFAGREFDAQAETGQGWKGLWIKRIEKDLYFSFLPEEGGTVKFQFEPNRWYSGNC